MLVSDSTSFEVVVCDNASKDNTQELLSQIHDPRFRYVRNSENAGAQKNWLKVLELGRGKWLYFVIGKDKILCENIPRLIRFLNDADKKGIVYFKDTMKHSGILPRRNCRIFKGIKAMIEFIGWAHPTGTIFNRDIFRGITDRARYYEISDIYPENYVRRDHLLKGAGAFIASGLGSGEGFVDLTKVKSTVEADTEIYSAWFAPRRLILRSFEFNDMVDVDLRDVFSIAERARYFGSKFHYLLQDVSFRWKYWRANDEQMAHYGHTTGHVRLSEMFRNMFTAYKETKAHLQEKGTFSATRRLIMFVCMMRVSTYISVYLTARAFLKSLLTSLRIWPMLQRVKKILLS